jgi:flagellar biosynthetic protein FliQ
VRPARQAGRPAQPASRPPLGKRSDADGAWADHWRTDMDSQQAFYLGQQGLYMLLLVSSPILLSVLVVGLLVSIFQAATQINENTLSFVPKVVAAVAVLAIAGPWMLTMLVDYIQRTLLSIPTAIG